MSTLIPFVPSTVAPFTFQPTLANNQYNAVVTWNVQGQRYYITITDLSGNRILTRAVTSSGPQLVSAFTWAAGFATATTTTPHNVPIGNPANIRTSGTNTAFDGNWQALPTGPNTMTYGLNVNPSQPIPLTGTVSFPLNLVGGVIPNAWLLYHWASSSFEYQS